MGNAERRWQCLRRTQRRKPGRERKSALARWRRPAAELVDAEADVQCGDGLAQERHREAKHVALPAADAGEDQALGPLVEAFGGEREACLGESAV